MGFFVPLAAAGLVRLPRCSGESRWRKVVCRGGKRVGLASDTRIRGRNIHRLLFRRSKHRKQVRQIAQQRKKRKFKLGWISGLLQWRAQPWRSEQGPAGSVIRG